MTDIHSSLQHVCHARACVPIVHEPGAAPHPLGLGAALEPLPDPANVQGDIYLLFPKVLYYIHKGLSYS